MHLQMARGKCPHDPHAPVCPSVPPSVIAPCIHSLPPTSAIRHLHEPHHIKAMFGINVSFGPPTMCYHIIFLHPCQIFWNSNFHIFSVTWLARLNDTRLHLKPKLLRGIYSIEDQACSRKFSTSKTKHVVDLFVYIPTYNIRLKIFILLLPALTSHSRKAVEAETVIAHHLSRCELELFQIDETVFVIEFGGLIRTGIGPQV